MPFYNPRAWRAVAPSENDDRGEGCDETDEFLAAPPPPPATEIDFYASLDNTFGGSDIDDPDKQSIPSESASLLFRVAAMGINNQQQQHLPPGSGKLDDPAEHFARLTRGFQAEIHPAMSATSPHVSDGYRAIEEGLDDMGTGVFQRRLLVLSAFGHFVEAAESQLLGVMLPVLMDAFPETPLNELAMVGSFNAVGCMIGSVLFGQISNVWGRRLSFQLSLTLCVVGAFLTSFAPSVLGFALLRLILGVGYGGNLVASTALLVEFTPSESRAWYMGVCGFAFGLGAIFVTALAWIVVPALGWRTMIRIVAVLGIPVLLMLPFLPESPRFYVMRGRVEDAMASMQVVARVNAKRLPKVVNPDNLRKVDATFHSKGMFLPTQALYRARYILVPLIFVWFTHAFASAIFMFVPLQMQQRDPTHTDLKYQVSMAMAVGGLLGCVILMFTSLYFGRLAHLRFGLIATALLTVLLGVETTSPVYIFVFVFILEIISQIPISMLYVYTPECVPTEVRTLVFAMCQVSHRLAPIVAPFAVTALAATSSFQLSCIVFGCMFLVSFIFSFGLLRETFGRGLVEDDDLAEEEMERIKVKRGKTVSDLGDI